MIAMSETMRAGVLHGVRDLRAERVPVPVPGPDEVLVQITTNGLCGSDIHFYKEGKLGPFVVDRPYIPGHECCGVVVQAAASGGPAVGTRVAIEPGVPCRRCALCKSGRYNLCKDVVFMSAPPVNGTFAEYAAVPADFAHVLPDAVDDVSGAFVEPLAVGVQACTRAGLTAASTVVVIGAGPIGLVTMLVARAFGAAKVYVIDGLPARLALATQLGADEAINFREVDPQVRVAELSVVLASGRHEDRVRPERGSVGLRLHVRAGPSSTAEKTCGTALTRRGSSRLSSTCSPR